MIDTHNHLLPNVDDGSSSFELTRKLLIDAEKEGIKEVCITPHFVYRDEYQKTKDELIPLFNRVKEENKDLNIHLTLGNELFIDKNLDILLKENKICSLNDSNYVLVEFPFNYYHPDYDEYLYNISLNYKIIIAHPERYLYVQQDANFVDRWLKCGYVLQSNSTSLNDSLTRKIIFKFIEHGSLSLIASDAHSEKRPLSLKAAYQMITKKFSKETADQLFDRNPYHVIHDEKLEKVKPIKRSYLGKIG